MAELGNSRYEAAAQILFRGGSAQDAAAAAGYKTDASSFKANAKKFVQRDDIQQRVRELQGQVAEKLVDVTADWIQQQVAKIVGADIDLSQVKASDVVAGARLLAMMIPGAMAPTKSELTGADGAPVVVEIVRFAAADSTDEDPPPP